MNMTLARAREVCLGTTAIYVTIMIEINACLGICKKENKFYSEDHLDVVTNKGCC